MAERQKKKLEAAEVDALHINNGELFSKLWNLYIKKPVLCEYS